MNTVRGRTAAVLAAALLLTGCGAAADDGATPGAPSPAPSVAGPAPLPVSLEQARAAWAAAGIQDYQLQVQVSCFCPRVTVSSTVKGGKATATDVQGTDGAPAMPLPGLVERPPRTVEDLFALVARQTTGRVDVTYSAQGVPLSIDADPMPEATDDEFWYTVVFSRTSGGEVAAGDSSWTKSALPAGVSWPAEAQDGGAGAQAVIVGKGTGAKLYLGLWGSSSCPAVPLTLQGAGVREQRRGPVATLRVDVDATSPADRVCTADLGPTVYVTALPAAAGDGTRPTVQLLTTTATGDRDAPGVTQAVVPAAGS